MDVDYVWNGFYWGIPIEPLKARMQLPREGQDPKLRLFKEGSLLSMRCITAMQEVEPDLVPVLA